MGWESWRELAEDTLIGNFLVPCLVLVLLACVGCSIAAGLIFILTRGTPAL